MQITILERFSFEVDDEVIHNMEAVMPSFVEFSAFEVERDILKLKEKHDYSVEEFWQKLYASMEFPFNKNRYGTFENYLYNKFISNINRVEKAPYAVGWIEKEGNYTCATCARYINDWLLEENDMEDWCMFYQARMDPLAESCGGYKVIDCDIRKKISK